jgi:hypothetical protein
MRGGSGDQMAAYFFDDNWARQQRQYDEEYGGYFDPRGERNSSAGEGLRYRGYRRDRRTATAPANFHLRDDAANRATMVGVSTQVWAAARNGSGCRMVSPCNFR